MTADIGRIHLLVWNYNYSSWSMRAGLALRVTGTGFDEDSVNGVAGPIPELAQVSPSGRFPVLLHGEEVVWDSLAIGEYLAERFPQSGLLPTDGRARGQARCLCAEIHAGLNNLRDELPMNIRRSGVRRTVSPAARAEIDRAFAIIRATQRLAPDPTVSLGSNGFSLCDAFVAPLIMRFIGYGVAMPDDIQAYADMLLAHGAVRDWIGRARSDPFVDRQYEFV